MSMGIADLEDLRADIRRQMAEMRGAAQRIEAGSPTEAANLRRIADRLDAYLREHLAP